MYKFVFTEDEKKAWTEKHLAVFKSQLSEKSTSELIDYLEELKKPQHPDLHKETVSEWIYAELKARDGETAKNDMKLFNLTCHVTVSAYTTVLAENEQEAIEKAKDRQVLIASGMADETEAWLVDELDGLPQNIHVD